MARHFLRGVIPIDGRLISLVAIENVLPDAQQKAA
jgi:hypothetical protein